MKLTRPRRLFVASMTILGVGFDKIFKKIRHSQCHGDIAIISLRHDGLHTVKKERKDAQFDAYNNQCHFYERGWKFEKRNDGLEDEIFSHLIATVLDLGPSKIEG